MSIISVIFYILTGSILIWIGWCCFEMGKDNKGRNKVISMTVAFVDFVCGLGAIIGGLVLMGLR